MHRPFYRLDVSGALKEEWSSMLPRHASEEALEEYAMGRLSAYRAHRLEDHLASCADCRDRLAVEIEIITGMKAAAAKLGIRKRAKARPRRRGIR
jgi:anti-sigma factor RsiW